MKTADFGSFVLQFPFQFLVGMTGGNDFSDIRINDVFVAVLDYSGDIVSQVCSYLKLGKIRLVLYGDQGMNHMVQAFLIRMRRDSCAELLNILGNTDLLI